MANDRWFVMRGANSDGPYTEQDLVRGFVEGRYSRKTLVWSEGSSDWKPLSETFELDDVAPPPLPASDPVVVGDYSSKISAWEKETPYPWRRYFARQFDTLVGAFAVSFVLGGILAATSSSAYEGFIAITENQIAATVLSVCVAVIPNAILLGLSGRTIGKLIFGLRVLRDNETPMGLGAAFSREFSVLVRGLGFGIPIVSLFTLIGGFNHLKAEKVAAWDQDGQLTTWYRPPGATHTVLMILGICAWFAFVALLLNLGRA